MYGGGVSYICDNNPNLHGKKFYGFDIVSPDVLKSEDPKKTAVLITTLKVKEVLEQIVAINDFDIFFGNVLLNEKNKVVHEELFGREEEINEVVKMLHDDFSKYVFLEVIRRRLIGEPDFKDLILPEAKMYILPEYFTETRPCDEIFIDCGAYNGDTVKKFISIFRKTLKKIYAFEPMREQYQKLLELEDYYNSSDFHNPQLITKCYGVSDKNGTTEFNLSLTGTGSYIKQENMFRPKELFGNKKTTIETVRLDDVIPMDEKITFIKMDIEGSEKEAILGAKKIIKNHKPRLAISIYHLGEDYYSIPILLRELVPEYNLCVRHHKVKHYDTVLYAYI